MGSNQYWAGRVYDLCVYYMTGTPEGSTESGFMEKPGIEPATPGLQGIALIHYTTGASFRCGASLVDLFVCVCVPLHTVMYVYCSRLVTCWESAGLLDLLYIVCGVFFVLLSLSHIVS